jgi:hypothetical protein
MLKHDLRAAPTAEDAEGTQRREKSQVTLSAFLCVPLRPLRLIGSSRLAPLVPTWTAYPQPRAAAPAEAAVRDDVSDFPSRSRPGQQRYRCGGVTGVSR